MDRISMEDLALLEVLEQISNGVETGPADSAVEHRLIASGLVEQGDESLVLTAAGIAMCKSLQHRMAADQLVTQDKGDPSDGGPPQSAAA